MTNLLQRDAIRTITLIFVSLFLLSQIRISLAKDTQPFQFPHIINQDQIKLELFPRSPDQIASFYEARGFTKEMIEILKQHCFITVRIHNKRDELLWLELENWQLYNNGKKIQRKHRNEWIKFWKDKQVPMHNQATFRWTLLPEVLDYLPDEQESGNLIIPRVEGNITLQATFSTGEHKKGKPIVIKYDKFSCVQN